MKISALGIRKKFKNAGLGRWQAFKGCAAHEDRVIDILLAEDDDAMRLYLERALERAGYCVVAVGRGTDALALVEGGEVFDLLLTDIVMPEMDGIVLAQRVMRLQPDIRVMFITGFSGVSIRAGRAVPDARLLSKPFHLKDLVAEVDRVLLGDPLTTKQP